MITNRLPKNWIRLITCIVIITFLSQNLVWAKDPNTLMPDNKQFLTTLKESFTNVQDPATAWYAFWSGNPYLERSLKRLTPEERTLLRTFIKEYQEERGPLPEPAQAIFSRLLGETPPTDTRSQPGIASYMLRNDLKFALKKALQEEKDEMGERKYAPGRVEQIINRGLAWTEGGRIHFEPEFDVFKVAARVLNIELRKGSDEQITPEQIMAVLGYHEMVHIKLRQHSGIIGKVQEALSSLGEKTFEEKLLVSFVNQYADHRDLPNHRKLVEELIATYYTEQILKNKLVLIDGDGEDIELKNIHPRIAEFIETPTKKFIDEINIRKLPCGDELVKLIDKRSEKRRLQKLAAAREKAGQPAPAVREPELEPQPEPEPEPEPEPSASAPEPETPAQKLKAMTDEEILRIAREEFCVVSRMAEKLGVEFTVLLKKLRDRNLTLQIDSIRCEIIIELAEKHNGIIDRIAEEMGIKKAELLAFIKEQELLEKIYTIRYACYDWEPIDVHRLERGMRIRIIGFEARGIGLIEDFTLLGGKDSIIVRFEDDERSSPMLLSNIKDKTLRLIEKKNIGEKGPILQWLQSNGWNLDELFSTIRGQSGWKNTKDHEIIKELDLVSELREEAEKRYGEDRGDIPKTAASFRLDEDRFQELMTELGIDLSRIKLKKLPPPPPPPPEPRPIQRAEEISTDSGRKLIVQMLSQNKFSDSKFQPAPFRIEPKTTGAKATRYLRFGRVKDGAYIYNAMLFCNKLQPNTSYRIEFHFSKKLKPNRWICFAYEVLGEDQVAKTPAVAFSGREESGRTKLYQLKPNDMESCLEESQRGAAKDWATWEMTREEEEALTHPVIEEKFERQECSYISNNQRDLVNAKDYLDGHRDEVIPALQEEAEELIRGMQEAFRASTEEDYRKNEWTQKLGAALFHPDLSPPDKIEKIFDLLISRLEKVDTYMLSGLNVIARQDEHHYSLLHSGFHRNSIYASEAAWNTIKKNPQQLAAALAYETGNILFNRHNALSRRLERIIMQDEDGLRPVFDELIETVNHVRRTVEPSDEPDSGDVLEWAVCWTVDLLQRKRIKQDDKLISKTVEYFRKIRQYDLYSSLGYAWAPAGIYWCPGAEFKIIKHSEVVDTVRDIVVLPQGNPEPTMERGVGLTKILSQGGAIRKMDKDEVITLIRRTIDNNESFIVERPRGKNVYYVYEEAGSAYEVRIAPDGHILTLYELGPYRTTLASTGDFSLAEADKLALIINQEGPFILPQGLETNTFKGVNRVMRADRTLFAAEVFLNKKTKDIYVFDVKSGDIVIIDRNGEYKAFIKMINIAAFFADPDYTRISEEILTDYRPREELGSWQEEAEGLKTKAASLKTKYDSKTTLALLSWMDEYIKNGVLGEDIPESVLEEYIVSKMRAGNKVSPGSPYAPVRFYRMSSGEIVVLAVGLARDDRGLGFSFIKKMRKWEGLRDQEILAILGETLKNHQNTEEENGANNYIYLKDHNFHIAIVRNDEVLRFSKIPYYKLGLYHLGICDYRSAFRLSSILRWKRTLDLPPGQEAALPLIQGRTGTGNRIERKVYYEKETRRLHVVDCNSRTCAVMDVEGNFVEYKEGVEEARYHSGEYQDVTDHILKPIEPQSSPAAAQIRESTDWPGEERTVSYDSLGFDHETGEALITHKGFCEIKKSSIKYVNEEIGKSELRRTLKDEKHMIYVNEEFRDFIVESLIDTLDIIRKIPRGRKKRRKLAKLILQGIFGNRANRGKGIYIRTSHGLKRNSSRYLINGNVVIVFNSGFINGIQRLSPKKARWLFCERLLHELYHNNPGEDTDRVKEETRAILNCDLLLYQYIGRELINEKDLKKIKDKLRSGKYFRFLELLISPMKKTKFVQRVNELAEKIKRFNISVSTAASRMLHKGCDAWDRMKELIDEDKHGELRELEELEMHMIHGSIVYNKKKNRGILLVGGNESGKSNIALQLAYEKNWELVTEDCAQGFFIGGRLLAGRDPLESQEEVGGEGTRHRDRRPPGILSKRDYIEIDQVIYLNTETEQETEDPEKILPLITDLNSHRNFTETFRRKLKNVPMLAIPVLDKRARRVAERIGKKYEREFNKRNVQRYVKENLANGTASEACSFPAGGGPKDLLPGLPPSELERILERLRKRKQVPDRPVIQPELDIPPTDPEDPRLPEHWRRPPREKKPSRGVRIIEVGRLREEAKTPKAVSILRIISYQTATILELEPLGIESDIIQTELGLMEAQLRKIREITDGAHLNRILDSLLGELSSLRGEKLEKSILIEKTLEMIRKHLEQLKDFTDSGYLKYMVANLADAVKNRNTKGAKAMAYLFDELCNNLKKDTLDTEELLKPEKELLDLKIINLECDFMLLPALLSIDDKYDYEEGYNENGGYEAFFAKLYRKRQMSFQHTWKFRAFYKKHKDCLGDVLRLAQYEDDDVRLKEALRIIKRAEIIARLEREKRELDEGAAPIQWPEDGVAALEDVINTMRQLDFYMTFIETDLPVKETVASLDTTYKRLKGSNYTLKDKWLAVKALLHYRNTDFVKNTAPLLLNLAIDLLNESRANHSAIGSFLKEYHGNITQNKKDLETAEENKRLYEEERQKEKDAHGEDSEGYRVYDGLVKKEERKIADLEERISKGEHVVTALSGTEAEQGRITDVSRLFERFKSYNGQQEETDINSVINEVISAANKDKVNITVENSHELPKIKANRSELDLALLNLILNAEQSKRKNQDKVNVTIKTSVVRKDGSEWVQIEVINDGERIPAGVRGRMFDARFTTGTFRIGIGLTYVRHLVGAYKGKINTESSETGTKFTLKFKAAERTEPAAVPAAPEVSAQRSCPVRKDIINKKYYKPYYSEAYEVNGKAFKDFSKAVEAAEELVDGLRGITTLIQLTINGDTNYYHIIEHKGKCFVVRESLLEGMGYTEEGHETEFLARLEHIFDLEDEISDLLPRSNYKRPTWKNLPSFMLIEEMSASPTLGANCCRDRWIGISAALYSVKNQAVKDIQLETTLAHELWHEVNPDDGEIEDFLDIHDKIFLESAISKMAMLKNDPLFFANFLSNIESILDEQANLLYVLAVKRISLIKELVNDMGKNLPARREAAEKLVRLCRKNDPDTGMLFKGNMVNWLERHGILEGEERTDRRRKEIREEKYREIAQLEIDELKEYIRRFCKKRGIRDTNNLDRLTVKTGDLYTGLVTWLVEIICDEICSAKTKRGKLCVGDERELKRGDKFWDLPIWAVKEDGSLDLDLMGWIWYGKKTKPNGKYRKAKKISLLEFTEQRDLLSPPTPNTAVATPRMYTSAQHTKTNVMHGKQIRTKRYASCTLQSKKSQIEWENNLDIPEAALRRRTDELINYLGEDMKWISGIQLYLVPPEDLQHPYYLRSEIFRELPEYQIAHAGSYKGKTRNVFMTYQAFLELPKACIAKIIKREARLASNRYLRRRATRIPISEGCTKEVEEILAEVRIWEEIKRAYPQLIERTEALHPLRHAPGMEQLWHILIDGRLPDGWPDLIGVMRSDGIIDEEDFRVVADIGRAVEQAFLRTSLTPRDKTLLAEAIAIRYFLENTGLGQELELELRNKLNTLGYGTKADRIIVLLRGIKKRLNKNGAKFQNWSDYDFVKKLEELLGMKIEDTKPNLADIRGGNENNSLIRHWADIFESNIKQREVLGLLTDKTPNGVIILNIKDLDTGILNWMEELKRHNIRGVKIGFIDESGELDESTIRSSVPDNIDVIIGNSLDAIKESSGIEKDNKIVYLASSEELQKYEERDIKRVVRGRAGLVIELSWCYLMLTTEEIESAYEEFLGKLVSLGFIASNEIKPLQDPRYIELPRIESVLKIWNELQEDTSYLEIWA